MKITYTHGKWNIVDDKGNVLFADVSKRNIIHEFRRLCGIRLSDADFAQAVTLQCGEMN